MKKTLLALALAWTSLTQFQLQSHAQELYLLSWRGTVYFTDDSGKVTPRPFTEKDFINQVAADNGLDPSTLAFAYRADLRDTVVADRQTGQFIADVIQMEYVFTDVSDPENSKTVRQALLFDEYHDSAIGSAFGFERQKRDSEGNLKKFSFRGTFQYSYPDEGKVYSGTFKTGKRIGGG